MYPVHFTGTPRSIFGELIKNSPYQTKNHAQFKIFDGELGKLRLCGPMDKAPAYGAKDCRFESCLSQIFKIFSDKFSKIDEKEFDSGRTRTYNLLLRRQAPYPLGHRAVGDQPI